MRLSRRLYSSAPKRKVRTTSSHALLALLPDEQLGVYLSTNANGGAVLREDLWGAFLDRFYPASPPAIDESVDLTQYDGTFLSNRYSTSSLTKVVLLLSGLNMRTEAGALVTPSMFGPGEIAVAGVALTASGFSSRGV